MDGHENLHPDDLLLLRLFDGQVFDLKTVDVLHEFLAVMLDFHHIPRRSGAASSTMAT